MAEMTDPLQKAMWLALDMVDSPKMSQAEFARYLIDNLWTLGYVIQKAPCSPWPREAARPAPKGDEDFA